jgi:hypothetical protein
MAHTNCSFESIRHQRILRGKSSGHASKRLQQRGITSGCLSMILAFGTPQHDGMGGIRYLMTPSAIDKLSSTLGRTKQITDMAGMYAVVSVTDGTVVTVGHRYQ